jgi:hypothetical protein
MLALSLYVTYINNFPVARVTVCSNFGYVTSANVALAMLGFLMLLAH